VELKVYCSEI